ncbi:MAG: small multi-drug export protein [Acidimicrobiales bacterium]
MLLEYGVLFFLAILAGGWAIPAGLLFGLSGLGVYLTCFAASFVTTLLLLYLGERFQDTALDRFIPDAESKVADSSAERLLDRWGVPGLAIVGGLILGPTITVLAALFFQVDRNRFTVYYLGSTAVVFALVTVFWSLVI